MSGRPFKSIREFIDQMNSSAPSRVDRVLSDLPADTPPATRERIRMMLESRYLLPASDVQLVPSGTRLQQANRPTGPWQDVPQGQPATLKYVRAVGQQAVARMSGNTLDVRVEGFTSAPSQVQPAKKRRSITLRKED